VSESKEVSNNNPVSGCAMILLLAIVVAMIAVVVSEELRKRDYWIQDLQKRIAVLEQRQGGR